MCFFHKTFYIRLKRNVVTYTELHILPNKKSSTLKLHAKDG